MTLHQVWIYDVAPALVKVAFCEAMCCVGWMRLSMLLL